MQVITENPSEVIPNISERVLDHKIVFALLRSKIHGPYLGQLFETSEGFRFKGQRVGSHCQSLTEWQWSTENLPYDSILLLMCELWNNYNVSYNIKFYVLDNWLELAQVIQEANQCPN
jgi:hypothetical protein